MMLRCCFLLVVSVFSSFALASERDVVQTAQANNLFSLDLLKLLDDGSGKNVFFSPYSISSALAMTSLGAKGNTLKEIDQTFHFDGINTNQDKFVVHRSYQELIDRYTRLNSNYTLDTANRLFGTVRVPIEETFQHDARLYYKAELEQVDFASGKAEGIINTWVENKTHDKIKNMFQPKSFDENTALVLVNAIYFKGSWVNKFKESATQKKTFYSGANKQKEVDTMRAHTHFEYDHDRDLKAQVLDLPYTGGNLKMVVVLPEERDGLSDVVKQLTQEKLMSIVLTQRFARKVDVQIPKFKLETDYELVPLLVKLGVNDAFTNRADLTGITRVPTKVSRVVHKAFVEVNEEGTEAAAATGVVSVLKSAGPRPVSFIADHPFFFSIVDINYGTILFNGVVYEP